MENPALTSLLKAIEEQKATDPFIAEKIASRFIKERLFELFNDPKGVHVESVFACLGSLAGYACQQSALATGGHLMTAEIHEKKYYFGEAINHYLIEDQYSLWSFIGGTLQSEGIALIDVLEIVKYTTETVGQSVFGQPRLPENIQIRFQPQECLQLWSPFKEQILEALQIEPKKWIIVYAITIQNLMNEAKSVLSPEIAAKIVMECAVPMSKLVLELS